MANASSIAIGGYVIATNTGPFHAAQVVVCCGWFPLSCRAAAQPQGGIVQLHSSDCSTPAALPPGEVLVVGTGQSGCQIAEYLHLAGRRMHPCVGDAPRVARRAVEHAEVLTYLDFGKKHR